MTENFPTWRRENPGRLRKNKGPNQDEPKETYSKTHHNLNTKCQRQGETLKSSKGETRSNIQRRSIRLETDLHRNTASQGRMAVNIPSNEKQRSATKTCLPS